MGQIKPNLYNFPTTVAAFFVFSILCHLFCGLQGIENYTASAVSFAPAILRGRKSLHVQIMDWLCCAVKIAFIMKHLEKFQNRFCWNKHFSATLWFIIHTSNGISRKLFTYQCGYKWIPCKDVDLLKTENWTTNKRKITVFFY